MKCYAQRYFNFYKRALQLSWYWYYILCNQYFAAILLDCLRWHVTQFFYTLYLIAITYEYYLGSGK